MNRHPSSSRLLPILNLTPQSSSRHGAPNPGWPWYVGSTTPTGPMDSGIWLCHIGDPFVLALVDTEAQFEGGISFHLRLFGWPPKANEDPRIPGIMQELFRIYVGEVDVSDHVCKAPACRYIFHDDFVPPPALFFDPVAKPPAGTMPCIIRLRPAIEVHFVHQIDKTTWRFDQPIDPILEAELRLVLPPPL